MHCRHSIRRSALYEDGVYFSRIQGALFNLFDVDHIEVLRGPQGTLYGKNTIGGAVNVVSRKPDTDTLKALGSFTYGSYNQILANGYVSVPLVTDKLALSLAGVYDKRDGTVTDPLTGRRYNDRNTAAGRAILRATPTDRIELILEADYTRQRTAPTLGYATAPLTNAVSGNRCGHYRQASLSLWPVQLQGIDQPGTWPGREARSLGDVVHRQCRIERCILDHFDHGLSGPAPRLLYRLRRDRARGRRCPGQRQQHQFSQELQLKYNGDSLKGVFGLSI